MAKSIETFENAVLSSVEQLADMPLHEWKWRYQFVGCKGTLYICESERKHPNGRFALLTDLKDFRLTTACGEIEKAEEHITVTTMNSRYIFKIK